MRPTPNQSLPHISMDVKARYVTQASAYDKLLEGKPLSDRRIVALARQGRYGPELQARFAAKVSRKRNTGTKTPLTTASLNHLVACLMQPDPV